jgi:hypothetical protein
MAKDLWEQADKDNQGAKTGRKEVFHSRDDGRDWMASQAKQGIYPHIVSHTPGRMVYRVRRPSELSMLIKTVFHTLGNETVEIHFYK